MSGAAAYVNSRPDPGSDLRRRGDGPSSRTSAPPPGLRPHPALPADTRLWAALQQASGGTWGGAVYDADRIIETLEKGK